MEGSASCVSMLQFALAGVLGSTDKKNVYGDELVTCSTSGMAMTGFTRDGYCTDLDDDAGSHHMCITMWPNGAGHSGDVNFCEQTGQGTPPNDWCEEKMACHEDAGKDCEIKNWCVCQWAWEMYVTKQGCENIVDLHCESVNMKALEAYEADPTEHAVALACLKEKCPDIGKEKSTAHVLAAH